MTIAIDFDGTCVSHAFPEIGRDIGAEEVLRKLVSNGNKLILWTMRSNKLMVPGNPSGVTSGQYLTEALAWFHRKGIPLWGVQSNPTQTQWTDSPKAYAELYIDDAALGAPLKFDFEISPNPFIDWKLAEVMLEKMGLI